MTETLSPRVLAGAYPDNSAIGTFDIHAAPGATYSADSGLTGVSNTAWPTANLVAYIPFSLGAPFLVRAIWWVNGTTPSGNIEVGVYNEAGVRMGTSGSTAAGTTVTLQKVTPTAFLLPGPARYYFAVTCDANTYTLGGPSSAFTTGVCGGLGIVTETTGSFGLTNPWGSVAILTAAEVYPHVGIANTTTI